MTWIDNSPFGIGNCLVRMKRRMEMPKQRVTKSDRDKRYELAMYLPLVRTPQTEEVSNSTPPYFLEIIYLST